MKHPTSNLLARIFIPLVFISNLTSAFGQDTTPPVISLVGDASVTVVLGGSYTEQGTTVTDNVDGNLNANVQVGGDVVNPGVIGTYSIKYNVSDAAGNAAATVSRTIVVQSAGGASADPVTIVGHYRNTANVFRGYQLNGGVFTQVHYPGAMGTRVWGVSGGKVVGDYNDGAFHGYIYDGSNYTSLNVPGAIFTSARGVSGNMVVGVFANLVNGQPVYHGFSYDGSQFATLDYPGAVETAARGIAGNVIVGDFKGSDNKYHGFK